MKQARPRCLLHIGCMKTGTTSLQRFLGENKPALLTQGILHPESLRRPGRYNHSGLVAFALDDDHEADVRRRFGLVDGATTQRFRLALQTEFAREMGQCPGL